MEELLIREYGKEKVEEWKLKGMLEEMFEVHKDKKGFTDADKEFIEIRDR